MVADSQRVLRIHITRPPDGGFTGHLSESLERLGLADRITVSLGPDLPIPSDTQVLVSGRPSAAELEACPWLEALVVPYAGIPTSTIALVQSRPGLRLHNLHHNAAPTAEHAVALLLAAARRIVPCDAALRRGDWRERYEAERGMLLSGRRALVIGYGEIGRRIGAALAGLGMAVAGVRANEGSNLDANIWAGAVFSATSLHALLPLADAVVIAVPATPATEGLIGAHELGLLPHHAVLVNVARGAVVNEEALFLALKENRLAAAGLDVWWEYPKDEASRESTRPSRFPFHGLDNVVMSPHRAGHCDVTEKLRAEHLASLLGELAGGNTAFNAIDLARGY